ncbi:tryptophan 2,3-dioxygenase family protein [Psychroflexus aestuariivivens]|uniref:tryptophan 2,3-dioxygenase family protein n=1 Tax=Psychroflexus aestuariivivens TaxID=1795040 RepID=UPI000FDB9A61|nr:tryptophan 2,3-dioxygenase family protein [Psychroflexus aestuariivivens]
MNDDLLKKIQDKYESMGENPDTYLKGLLHAKPINYWDYIEVDSLLSLQKPRTNFKDESVFIIYHQVTELTLKLMIHEIKQLTEAPAEEAIFIEKLRRLVRYTDMLITSFDVMKDGMSYEDYNEFRMTLAPASGFQSAQFRYLEIYCTPLINLINEEGLKHLPKNPSTEELFQNIYWRDAGYDRKTGKTTHTLNAFEDKYLADFIRLANAYKGQTLYERFEEFDNPSENLKRQMQAFDHQYNVKWPLVHLRTATKYLDKKGENKKATGGSEWKKYLHPKFQQRTFFPKLWKDESMLDWE